MAFFVARAVSQYTGRATRIELYEERALLKSTPGFLAIDSPWTVRS